MGVFQHKFGKKERHGLYFGLGVKPQIPISSSFKRFEGDIKTWGYYPKWHLILGEKVELPDHGFGTNKKIDWKGDNALKTGIAAVGEFGFLFGLSPRVDLTLGVTADYGLTNISKKNEQLLELASGVTQQESEYIGQHILYKGLLNSDQITKINPWSIRGKIGLRIKIGPLKPIDTTDTDKNEPGARPARTPIIDTIFVYPVIKYIYPDDYQSSGEGDVYRTPPPPREPIPEDDEEELLESIYFDLDKSTLTAKSIEVLDRKVALMRKYPQAVLTVVGNTCDIGTGEHNDKLSYDRAEAARIYLIRKGINPTRIIPVPMGKRAQVHGLEHRELNRRVDFYLAR
jgi:outer membrane protein OmpA-like peptidoglycan-associated protein